MRADAAPTRTTPRGGHGNAEHARAVVRDPELALEIRRWTLQQAITRAAYNRSTKCADCGDWITQPRGQAVRCTPCLRADKANRDAAAYRKRKS